MVWPSSPRRHRPDRHRAAGRLRARPAGWLRDTGQRRRSPGGGRTVV